MSKRTCDICQLWNSETCKCTVREVLPCMSSCEEAAKMPMTNGDKIRATSDEELARFLYDVATHYAASSSSILDWLKKEAKDE